MYTNIYYVYITAMSVKCKTVQVRIYNIHTDGIVSTYIV